MEKKIENKYFNVTLNNVDGSLDVSENLGIKRGSKFNAAKNRGTVKCHMKTDNWTFRVRFN